MKALCTVALLLTLTLSCCTSPHISSTPTAATPRGTQLGDTGIRVSGTVDAGGSTAIR